MGLVQRETIKGSVYSYLGVLVGFITIVIIQPKVLNEEQVGLLGLLNDFSVTFATFAFIGFSATIRYFPYFRSVENKHNGYLFLACSVAAVGFLLVAAFIYFFKSFVIGQSDQGSPLFSEYYYYFIPLVFFTLYFNVFELFARALFKTVASRFLREFLKRIFVLIPFLLLLFQQIAFPDFMPLWLVASILPTFILFWYISRLEGFSLKPKMDFLDTDMKRKLARISFYAILAAAAPSIVATVDKYMINSMYGLSKTGIYTITMYFSVIILLPTRSLYSVALPVVAEAWKANDRGRIERLYKQSCVNQLLIGALLFLGIWGNVHNVFAYIPEYKSGMYVIFFMGIANIFEMATGINGTIIATSKYYRYDTFFYLFLAVLTIVSNLIFLSIYGFIGAAIATALTYMIFNLFRYLFVLRAFKMQPFGWKNLGILVLAVAVYFLSKLIPVHPNYIVDLIVRSSAMGVAYLVGAYYLRFSEELNSLVDAAIEKFLGSR